ncbi:MAG: hypothetical protein POG24_08075, partial [Acidocella sp.]|nr:hypothetical protein [Acidocella sp.]
LCSQEIGSSDPTLLVLGDLVGLFEWSSKKRNQNQKYILSNNKCSKTLARRFVSDDENERYFTFLREHRSIWIGEYRLILDRFKDYKTGYIQGTVVAPSNGNFTFTTNKFFVREFVKSLYSWIQSILGALEK